MNMFVKLLQEEYELGSFKLMRLRINNGYNKYTIFLTPTTLFRYDSISDDVILGDCYLNTMSNKTSVMFKGEIIKSMSVLKRKRYENI